MKIKNIYSSLFLVLAVVAFSACTFQQEDLFDESASLRIEHFNDQLKQRLVDQSTNGNKGWVIQYFVAGSSEEIFEGVNLFGSFEASGKVTLASNHRFMRNGNANKYTECVSTYELLREEGPVLAFNTWNDVLTVLVDPVNPTSGANDGEGMNGDQNLAFKAYDGNNILFRGERHSAEVRFVPCTTDWAAYTVMTALTKQRISSSTLNSYYVTNGVDTLYFTGLNTGIISYQERLVEPLEVKTLTCVFSPTGFRINHVDSLADNAFQEFTLSDDRSHLLSEDGKTKVIPAWDWYITDCSSTWKLDESTFTDEQKTLYQQMAAEVKKAGATLELDSIAIGRIQEMVTEGSLSYQVRYPGLVCCIHGPKKMGRVPQYRPYIDMDIDQPEYGVINFGKSALSRSIDNMKLFEDTDLKSLCEQFAASIYGTYNMVPDNYFRPTQATLTPANGGNSILLKLKPIAD